jgi:peptidyl-prolyl cis-trans isomerase D
MLSEIRKNVAHPYIKVLLGLIIFVFIFFFGWSMRSGRNDTAAGVVAVVNGEPITPAEYGEAYNGLVDFYRRITQGALSAEQLKELGLEQRALDLVIDRKILLQEADKRNFSVSDDEVKAAIQNQASFREGNQFSAARYHQLLKAQGMAPERYEALKRQELLLSKVEESLRTNASVSDQDVEKEYRDRNTKIAADYVAFDPAEYTSRVAVTDQKLQEFLTKEGEAFRTDERRAARYVFFPVDDYTSQIRVSDEDLKQEYKARAFQFQEAEGANVRHILVRAEPVASEDAWKKAENRAAELRRKIVGGGNFADVAKRESDDTATKSAGGDVGWVARGALAPAFEKAVFALGAGEVSAPVKSDTGYHLFQVTAKRPARERPFAEVRAELLRTIQREKAREIAFKAADAVLMDLEDKKATWSTLPGGKKAVATSLVSLRQKDSSVPDSPKFLEALFALSDASLGELVDTPEGTYLVSLAQKRPAAVPSLAEARAAVEARYRIVESKNLAKNAAELFAADAAKTGWTSALASRRLTAATTQTIVGKGANIEPLGSSPEAKKALFENPQVGKVLASAFEIGDKYYAFRLGSVSTPDSSGLTLQREQILKDLLPAKREEAFEAEMEKLRKAAKIENVDPSLQKQQKPS